MGLFILLFSPQKVVKQLEYTQNGENQFIVGAYVCAYFEGEFLCVLSRFLKLSNERDSYICKQTHVLLEPGGDEDLKCFKGF